MQNGLNLMLIACIFSTITSSIAKYLSTSLPSNELVFLRSLVGFLILCFFINFKKISTSKLHILFLRAIIGAFAILLYFYNISMIGFAKAVTFTKSTPIFLAIIGFFFFKERLKKIDIFAILLGLSGVYFIFDPNEILNLNDILGVLNAILIAIAYALIKDLKDTYDFKVIIASFLLVATLISFFVSFFDGFNFVMPTYKELNLALLMGICGILFQIFMTLAYLSKTKIALVGAISYIEIIFSCFLGSLLGDKMLSTRLICGIILIITSGIIISIKGNK